MRGLVDILSFFFFQAEDGIRDLVRSRGLGDVYKRQIHLIPRHYTIDDHAGVRQPLGMHGFRLEIEAHIVLSLIHI